MPSQQIEQTLAPLVYSQLQDQAPKLHEHLLGFQLVAEENEGKKCLGILAFNIYGKHYFLCAFYINGFLKPLIHLFDTDRKVFIPATEKITDAITKPKPGIGATVVPRDEYRQAISTPNLYQMSMPPIGFGKAAKLIVKSVNEKYIPSFESEFAKADTATKVAFLRKISKERNLVRAMAEKYPSVVKEIESKKPDLVLSTPISDKASTADRAPTVAKKAELEFIEEPSSDLPIEDNQKIYSDGLLIKDNRAETNTIKPKFIEDGKTWGDPIDNGLYRAFDSNGKIIQIWILKGAKDTDRYASCASYIIDPDTLEYSELPTNLLCEKIEPDIENLMEDTIPMESMEIGKEYFLINPNLKSNEFIGPVDLRSQNRIYCNHDVVKFMFNPHTVETIDPFSDGSGTIVISKDIRALPVKQSNKPKMFGTFKEFMEVLYKHGFDDISIDKTAGLYSITDKNKLVKFSGYEMDTIKYLMKNEGLNYKDAKSAMELGGSYFIAKKAGFGAPVEEPTYEFIQEDLPKIPDNYTTDVALNPYTDPSYGKDTDIQQAMQSSESGQADVFDASLVGILAKSQNNVERLKEIIPILSKSIHSMGSLLFDLWWKPENYSKDFTSDELYTMEQNVLECFKSQGDLALMITQRKKLYGDSI